MLKLTGKIDLSSENNFRSNQKWQLFQNLIYHREYDIENASAEVIAKYLFDSLTRNTPFVTIPDKSDNNLNVEYRTQGVEYFDPKEGKTLQHALVIHGIIHVVAEGSQYKSIKSATKLPDMLFVVITQGVNKSKVRFDSDNIPQNVFDAFVNSILKDLLGYVPTEPPSHRIV